MTISSKNLTIDELPDWQSKKYDRRNFEAEIKTEAILHNTSRGVSILGYIVRIRLNPNDFVRLPLRRGFYLTSDMNKAIRSALQDIGMA